MPHETMIIIRVSSALTFHSSASASLKPLSLLLCMLATWSSIEDDERVQSEEEETVS